MNIVCILGSPRPNGNSTIIAERFLSEARHLGAEVQTHRLNRMTFRGCQACGACKGRLDHCALNDDLTPVLESIHTADILVLATPVYFADVTGQMKSFIDRTYSLYVPDFMTNPQPSRLPPGKRLVFIQAQAQPEASFFNDIYPRYDFFFQVLGFRDNRLIRALGVNDKGDAEARQDILESAAAAAREIIG